MRFAKFTILLLALTLHTALSYGQEDSNITTIADIPEVPLKLIKETNNKIDKYSNQIKNKRLERN